jgi:hypothetical protein
MIIARFEDAVGSSVAKNAAQNSDLFLEQEMP